MFNSHPVMQSTAALLHLPHAGRAALIILLLASMIACATQHTATLKVNPRHDAGAQYQPEELNRMMTILGYQRLRVKDPVTQQSVAVAEKYGEYRMLFQSLQDNNIRVDIHIVKADGRIALYFYNINNSALDESSLRLYEQLRQRLKFEYGAENVSGSQP
jgi:hypothetical protein